MDLTKYKIGYWPYTPACDVAGDRRRFVFYASERKFSFEIASSKKQYDIVYLTSNCNCTEWIAYKKKYPGTKIIFELIDSYLLENLNRKNLFRGAARFIRGKENRVYIDYRKAFRKMISAADAVVCSTPVQRESLLAYNKNVHISLDYFSNDINDHKIDYSTHSKLKLVWEGQAYTAYNLLSINNALQKLRNEVELHIITDPVIRLPVKMLNKKTEQVLKKIKCDFIIHPWKKETFSKLIAASDLSIIPILKTDKLAWNKPENKLLLLWETGIPVLTSPTPAYRRVMAGASVEGVCETEDEWVKKIIDFKNKPVHEKQKIAKLAENYLLHHHSKEIILKNWDAIFESVLPSNGQ